MLTQRVEEVLLPNQYRDLNDRVPVSSDHLDYCYNLQQACIAVEV